MVEGKGDYSCYTEQSIKMCSFMKCHPAGRCQIISNQVFAGNGLRNSMIPMDVTDTVEVAFTGIMGMVAFARKGQSQKNTRRYMVYMNR